MVSRPEYPPGTCIVNLSSEDPGGFVDLGDRVLIDPRVYVSRQAVIDLGRLFGFASPGDVQSLQEHVDVLELENASLRVDNAQLTRDVEAAEWTLERQFGTRIQNKPGRPRKAVA